MIDGLLGIAQEIRVMCYQSTTCTLGKKQLIRVLRSSQSAVLGCGYIDTISTQTACNIQIDILVQVKTNPFTHW